MVGEFLFTLVLFGITVSAIPLFTFSYLILNIFRKIWHSFLSLLYSDVEFVKEDTVRILLDTQRNQGIVTVLLHIKGQTQPEAIRRHLQEVVNRRNRLGELVFPRLRQCLVTKCGTYGWQSEKFDLDLNVVVAPNIYKGRPVAEYNIQDYVSDIVAKYLPSNTSPWQFTIIPATNDFHYILLKIHHVLLLEGLNVGDLLPILPPTRTNSGLFSIKSPLVNVFKKPVVLPKLKEQLTDEISIIWNVFITNYDPLERPELLKYVPTFPQFIAVLIISIVATLKECRRGFNFIKNDNVTRLIYIITTAKKETMKREVNARNFILSVLVSMSPKNIISAVFWFCWTGLVSIPLQSPIFLYAETRAFYTCLTLEYCPYPHTIVGILYKYVPLFYKSLKEIFQIISILLAAPKTVLQDILLQKESLQTITLCGRKCVAWSDPINIQIINEIAAQYASTETDIMLTAVSKCISQYLIQISHPLPTDLPIFIRNISSNYVYATGPNIKPEDAESGVLCLNLSILDPDKERSGIENLLEVKNKFNTALKKQGLSHLLTILQTKFGILTKFLPSTCLSIYLKYLSSKYSVSVTEVTSRYPHVIQRTLWGQEVLSVIYWRPPQANTSISLCLNEYADDVRLGVMCDAQLMPYHTALVRGFPQYIQDLKRNTKI